MIKNIVVHLTGSDEDEVRLEAAEGLAAAFNAHLTGLLMHVDPEIAVMPEAAYAGVGPELIQEEREKTERRRKALTIQLDKMGVPNDLRVVEGWRSTIGGAMAAEAHVADLFVGTRPYGDPNKEQFLEEGVLFGSGTPCLLLPPGYRASMPPQTVLVAWKSTRECARATRDAIPFMLQARQVVVAFATERADEERHNSSAADVARYLSRHGISLEVREMAGWEAADEAILTEAKDQGADLIVAGAFGHSRLQERVMGGVTRTLLTRCELPVLLSR